MKLSSNLMKLSISPSTTLAFLIALAAAPAMAQTQTAAAPGRNQTEVAAEYTYAHANAPPADCGCFSLNGGSISLAQPFGSGHYVGVFDMTFVHASNISTGNYDLTLSVFTGGLRYRPTPHARWNPFGEVLLGVDHPSGSLVEGSTPAATDAALVFATNIGGGLDRRLNSRWSLRLVEADYLLTTSSNRANEHQNNLRISTGLVYRFGK
jgi:outer membrane immunogenic protein